MSDTRRVHELIERLPPAQLAAVEVLLEAIIDDEELSQEDRQAIAVSREHFSRGGQGVAFEQVVADCGLTMDEVRHYKVK